MNIINLDDFVIIGHDGGPAALALVRGAPPARLGARLPVDAEFVPAQYHLLPAATRCYELGSGDGDAWKGLLLKYVVLLVNEYKVYHEVETSYIILPMYLNIVTFTDYQCENMRNKVKKYIV